MKKMELERQKGLVLFFGSSLLLVMVGFSMVGAVFNLVNVGLESIRTNNLVLSNALIVACLVILAVDKVAEWLIQLITSLFGQMIKGLALYKRK